MDELKISRQKVLDAAEKCPTFKNVAKELWPEVFGIDMSKFTAMVESDGTFTVKYAGTVILWFRKNGTVFLENLPLRGLPFKLNDIGRIVVEEWGG